MRAITLSYYDIKRLLRRRALVVFLVAAPLLVAAVRAALPQWRIGLIAAWTMPFICLALVLAILYLQRREDAASNFLVGITSSPLSQTARVVSRAIVGVALFAAQLVPFAVILSLRF